MEATQANLQFFFTGLQTAFNSGYAEAPDPLYGRVCQSVPSTAEGENYGWILDVGPFRELLGEATAREVARGEYYLRNKDFYNLIEVDENKIADDAYGIYTPQASMMGQQARVHGDHLLMRALVNGFTAKDYTGKPFFATDKVPFKGSKSKYDTLVNGPLNEANFDTALELLTSRTWADGETPMTFGAEFILLTGPSLRKQGKQIVDATAKADGATNLNIGEAEHVVWPWLVGPHKDKWFLLAGGGQASPFIFQDREAIRITQGNVAGDHWMAAGGKYQVKGKGRRNLGYFIPELAVGSKGV